MAFLAFLWNFFLYLATLAWAIRNETESEHFTSAHVFRARVKLHLGPESPDVGSFIPLRMGPMARREGQERLGLGANVSPG